MSQDHLITLKCADCKEINYRTVKNKKQHPDKIEMKKHCKACRKHTKHAETKKFMK